MLTLGLITTTVGLGALLLENFVAAICCFACAAYLIGG